MISLRDEICIADDIRLRRIVVWLRHDKENALPKECIFFQPVKKLVFDRLAEVKEVVKASNSHSSAYKDTVEGELRSKSKHLAQQGTAGSL